MVMGVFPPVSPPTVPTPQRVLDSAVSSRANAMFLVPSFLEVRLALCNDWHRPEFVTTDLVIRRRSREESH